MNESKHTRQELAELQALPLSLKVRLTQQRIREWVNHYGVDGIYVSFSGGKDSTVLLHLVRDMFPDVVGVFCDTGLEFPEIRQFVRTFDNIVWLKPKKNFRTIIEQYGYPVISKDISQQVYDIRVQSRVNGIDYKQTNQYIRKFDPNSEYGKRYPSYCLEKYSYLFESDFLISHMCCNIMKKGPFKKFEKQTGKHGILAIMAEESRLRRTIWLKKGCNAFDGPRPISRPMSFWTEQDVLRYIKQYNIPIASIYGDVVVDDTEQVAGQMNMSDYGLAEITEQLKTTGAHRTGCMFCAYGCTQKDWSSFERLKVTHPKIYDYIMRPWEEGGLNYKEVIDWLNENGNLNIRY